MAKKQIESNLVDSGTWYKIPVYKVLLVKDGNTPSDVKAINSPADVVDTLGNYLEGADREHCVIALLDRKGKIIGINTVSVGDLSSSIVHPREVFKPAIILGAASIILCHNHPSGDPAPSREDIEITRRLVEAGQLLQIEILDHVILGDNCYCSLKEKGLI